MKTMLGLSLILFSNNFGTIKLLYSSEINNIINYFINNLEAKLRLLVFDLKIHSLFLRCNVQRTVPCAKQTVNTFQIAYIQNRRNKRTPASLL